MKKTAVMALLALALAPTRADVTNYVYTVSNIYIRVYETRMITNRVQNTAYFYYVTNNVTTITNIWNINHTTNYNYNVVNTNFGPWIASASNQANRASFAAIAATNMANVASTYATLAGSRASSAQSSAALALQYKNEAQSAVNSGLSSISSRVNTGLNDISGRVNSGLNEINSRISYFDQYAGQMVTNVYIYESGVTVTNVNVSMPTNEIFNAVSNLTFSTVTNLTLSTITNAVLDVVTNLTLSTVTNLYQSYTTVTNVVLDYSGATNVNVSVTTNQNYYTVTNVLIQQHQTYSTVTNMNNVTVVSNTYILGGSGIDLQTLSIPYVATNGTEYANIQYYPLGHPNGKVCATPGSGATAAQSILFAPVLKNNRSMTFPDDCFEFRVGYVDSDEGGLRIHYVARSRGGKIWNYQSGVDFAYFPRDFYWQGGYYYAIVDACYWSDTSSSYTFVGRFTYRAAASFPNSVNATSSDSTSSAYQRMDVISYFHKGSAVSYDLKGYIKTQHGGALPAGSPLWVPASPSPEQAEVIEWTNTTFPVYY